MGPLRRTVIAAASAALAVSLAGPAAAQSFPEVITLPDGWGADGVAGGPGTTVYAGSLASGAVHRADVCSGQGSVLAPGWQGRVAVGLKHSGGLLCVAGGPTGKVFVYDATTGADVAEYQVGPAQGAFVNDVTVTGGAAWFTDSFRPVLYRVALFAGRPFGPAQEVPLGGEWTQIGGPGTFNANGIATTANGKDLIVVNSTEGCAVPGGPGHRRGEPHRRARGDRRRRDPAAGPHPVGGAQPAAEDRSARARARSGVSHSRRGG
jgi:sugar lactone lactonase YvrE